MHTKKQDSRGIEVGRRSETDKQTESEKRIIKIALTTTIKRKNIHTLDGCSCYPNCEFMCVYFDEQRTRSIHNGFYRFDMQTNHNTARRCMHRRYKTIYWRIAFVTYPYLQYFALLLKLVYGFLQRAFGTGSMYILMAEIHSILDPFSNF